ncbi:hypothetical protein ACS0PU_011023 [Formica fusca]
MLILIEFKTHTPPTICHILKEEFLHINKKIIINYLQKFKNYKLKYALLRNIHDTLVRFSTQYFISYSRRKLIYIKVAFTLRAIASKNILLSKFQCYSTLASLYKTDDTNQCLSALASERYFNRDIYSFRSLITYSIIASPFRPPPHFMVARNFCPESSMKLTPLCIRLIARIAVAICERKTVARLCDFPREWLLPRTLYRRTSVFCIYASVRRTMHLLRQRRLVSYLFLPPFFKLIFNFNVL